MCDPDIKAQKNDDRDAEGIAEAATRPTMRFVELKTQQQLDMQTLHRSRDRLVAERTALINQLRAILLERGIIVPQGRRELEDELFMLINEQRDVGVSPRLLKLVRDMRTEWRELDRRITVFDKRVCGFREGEPRRAAIGDDSWRWRNDRFGVDCRSREGGGIRARARSCGMAWTCPASSNERWQAETSWHQQAR